MRRLIAVAVGHQAAFRSQQSARMIMPLANRRRIGQAGDHLAALIAHGAKRIAQHFKSNRIQLHGPILRYK